MPRVHTIDGPQRRRRRRRKPLGALMTERACYVNRNRFQDVLKCAKACRYWPLIEDYNGRRNQPNTYPGTVYRGRRGTAFFWMRPPKPCEGRTYAVMMYDPQTCSLKLVSCASKRKTAQRQAREAAKAMYVPK